MKQHVNTSHRRTRRCSSIFINDDSHYKKAGLHISEVNVNIDTIVLSTDSATSLNGLSLFACSVDVFSEPDEILLQLITFPDMHLKRDTHVMILLDQDPRKKVFEGKKNLENGVIFRGRSLKDHRGLKKIAILLGEQDDNRKKYILLDRCIGEYESDFAILTKPASKNHVTVSEDKNEEQYPFHYFVPYAVPKSDTGYVEALVYSFLSNSGRLNSIIQNWNWIYKTLFQFDVMQIQSHEEQIINDFILNEKILITKRKILSLLHALKAFQHVLEKNGSFKRYIDPMKKSSVMQKINSLNSDLQSINQSEIKFFFEMVGEMQRSK